MNDPDAKEKLASLEEGIDKFKPEDQAALWAGLGNAYQQLRDFPNVKRCYQKLVDERPNELYPWENMFDVAMAYGDDPEAHVRPQPAAPSVVLPWPRLLPALTSGLLLFSSFFPLACGWLAWEPL